MVREIFNPSPVETQPASTRLEEERRKGGHGTESQEWGLEEELLDTGLERKGQADVCQESSSSHISRTWLAPPLKPSEVPLGKCQHA